MMPQMMGGPGGGPAGPGVAATTQTLSLYISCRDLPDLDVASYTDPFVKVQMSSPASGGRFVSIGKTETISDCLDPDFVTPVTVVYNFEMVQNLKFKVVDKDDYTDDDAIGSVECTLAAITTAPNGLFKCAMKMKNSHAKKKATMSIRAEQEQPSRSFFHLHFRCEKLDNKDGFFGKSDPYLVFSRSNEDGTFTVCHKTETVKNDLSPTFRPFQLAGQTLCRDVDVAPIMVECIDYDEDDLDDSIGSATFTIADLLNQQLNFSVPLINEKKRKKKGSKYKNSGTLRLASQAIKTIKPTFLDYMSSGCVKLTFTVAVDLTGSNGDPRKPSSLHHHQPPQAPSQYARVIRSVGDILAQYDADGQFPALGFGACLPPTYQHAEFEFPLNPQNWTPQMGGSGDGNPHVAGIDGILSAYGLCVHSVTLSGPTLFTPVINHVSRFAAAYNPPPGTPMSPATPLMYFVLVILTDGVISDVQNTVDALVNASSLPMSVIIVGIGNADFSAMECLDGDVDPAIGKGALRAKDGKRAERDIVQFVPFNKFLSGGYAQQQPSIGFSSHQQGNPAPMMAEDMLARELLAELPNQVREFYYTRKILPPGLQ